MDKQQNSKQLGFTIVELLIVIVVIAILAAITIVAYNGIQQRARDSSRTTAINGVMKALEFYKADNGNYPSVGTDNSGYPLSSLAAALVPTYINSIPNDPNTSLTNYQYVRGTAASGSYGIRISYETRTACHEGVNNGGVGWWSLQAC
jgi:type II secretion system protein G